MESDSLPESLDLDQYKYFIPLIDKTIGENQEEQVQLETFSQQVHKQCTATAAQIDRVVKQLAELKTEVCKADKDFKKQIDTAMKAMSTSINTKKEIKKSLDRNTFTVEEFQRQYARLINLAAQNQLNMTGFKLDVNVEASSTLAQDFSFPISLEIPNRAWEESHDIIEDLSKAFDLPEPDLNEIEEESKQIPTLRKKASSATSRWYYLKPMHHASSTEIEAKFQEGVTEPFTFGDVERYMLKVDLTNMEGMFVKTGQKMSLHRNSQTGQWSSRFTMPETHCKELDRAVLNEDTSLQLMVKAKKQPKGKKKPTFELFGTADLEKMTVTINKQKFPLVSDNSN